MTEFFSKLRWLIRVEDVSSDPLSHPQIAAMDLRMLADLPPDELRDPPAPWTNTLRGCAATSQGLRLPVEERRKGSTRSGRLVLGCEEW